MTHILTITCPKAFKDGPQFDDDGNLISHGLETHTATDKAKYEKHMPEVDGNPQTHKRQHVIFGWPEIHD